MPSDAQVTAMTHVVYVTLSVRARGRGSRRARAPHRLRQRDELPEEGARLRRVDPVDDIRREAEDVAGDRDAHLRRGLGRAAAEELRPAGIAAAGPAITGRLVLRDAQIRLVQRVELADGVPPLHREGAGDAAGSGLRLLDAV